MECGAAREAVSARLDGELNDTASSELDHHLAACAECRRWRDGAHAVTRRARIAIAPIAPGAPASLLATVGESAPTRSLRLSELTQIRLALVGVALVQLILTVPALVLGSDGAAPIHVAHEMGAFDAALAFGFLAAAWRPANARGMHLLVGGIALLLAVTAGVDLATGRTTPAAEAPHLLAVAGWVLLRILAHRYPGGEVAPLRAGRRREPEPATADDRDTDMAVGQLDAWRAENAFGAIEPRRHVAG